MNVTELVFLVYIVMYYRKGQYECVYNKINIGHLQMSIRIFS